MSDVLRFGASGKPTLDVVHHFDAADESGQHEEKLEEK
jgi:hypothetical protein